MRWVVFVSLCGFYAGVARRVRELPAAAPVVVMHGGAALDGDRQAYTLGLRPGSPARQVLRTCPGAALVEFEAKEALPAAQALWELCLRHTPLLEPAAVQEVGAPTLHQVWLGLPTPTHRPPRAEVVALQQSLQAAGSTEPLATAAGRPAPSGMKTALGFSAPTGLASNKLVARAAAQLQRDALLGVAGGGAPGGTLPVVVEPGEEAAFLARLPLAYLWRATPPERRRLGELGLRTIGELAAVPEAELLRQFGVRGQLLRRWSLGIDTDPVQAAWPPRTVTARLAFASPQADGEVLAAALARLAADLAAGLQRRDEACQQATLQVELAPGKVRCAERTFSRPQNSSYYIEQSLVSLLRRTLATPAAPIALEACLGNLTPVRRHQATLLADLQAQASAPVAAPPVLAAAAPPPAPAPPVAALPDPERAARLEFTVAALQERYPRQQIHFGLPTVPSRREAMLTLYDPYRWGSLAEGARQWPESSASR